MKILVSAAEASSDAHGAELLAALKEKFPSENFEFVGMGGPLLQAQGLRAEVDSRKLLVMGFGEILFRLPVIVRSFFRLVRVARREKPDGAILIDYPDFHFRLAKRLWALGIPVISYIPPKVWAWRKRRVRFLKYYFDQILSILPFEREFYEKSAIPFRYVGNPLCDELPLNLSREEARAKLGISEDDWVAVVLPGSRPHEIEKNLSVAIETLRKVAVKLRAINALSSGRKLKVLMPVSRSVELADIETRLPDSTFDFELKISQGNAPLCMVAGDVGIIKSGTSTLEAALLGLPHLVVYRVSRLTEWIVRYLIRYRNPVGLSNLVLGIGGAKTRVFREFLGRNALPDKMASEVIALLLDSKRRGEVTSAIREIRKRVLQSESPSRNAADEVMRVIENRRQRALTEPEQMSPISFWKLPFVLSAFWSLVNLTRRLFLRAGWRTGRKLPIRVVGIGNIQAGGAGKTPLVIHVCEQALQKRLQPAILLRGYRSQVEKSGRVIEPFEKGVSSREVGDEAALLHELLPAVWIGVGRDRIDLFQRLNHRTQEKLDLVVLDDSFQNFRLKQDLKFVAVTSRSWWRGIFRDFPSQLRWADGVVWTKGRVRPRVPLGVPLFESRGVSRKQRTDVDYILFTAVADADHVRGTLLMSGYRIVRHHRSSDHEALAEKSFQTLIHGAIELDARILTTGKDWVKLKVFEGQIPSEVQVEIVEPKIEVTEGLCVWERMLWEHPAPEFYRSVQAELR